MVDRIRIRSVRIDRVEELHVLLVRKLEFHDIERLRHGTKGEGLRTIRRITWITDGDKLSRKRA